MAMATRDDDFAHDVGGIAIASLGGIVLLGSLAGVASGTMQRSRYLELRGSAMSGGAHVALAFRF